MTTETDVGNETWWREGVIAEEGLMSDDKSTIDDVQPIQGDSTIPAADKRWSYGWVEEGDVYKEICSVPACASGLERIAALEALVLKLATGTIPSAPRIRLDPGELVATLPPSATAKDHYDRDPRSKDAIREAVNACCTCGGSGPDDDDACPACMVWHHLGLAT